jgi:hypothetical protein
MSAVAETKNKKRKTKIVALTAALVVAGGAAFAYWTAGGTGSGSADTGTSANVTIVQTAFPADALYPGGPAVALSGTFSNPNDGPVHVNQVTVAVDPSWSAGTTLPCTAADFALVQPTLTNADVLANDTSTWGGASIRMLNSSTNQDSCKNVQPPLVYTSN